MEEKTGTISVVETIGNFDRTDYEFEAVATDNRNMIISTNVTIHVVYSDSSQTLTKYVALIAKFTPPQFLFHLLPSSTECGGFVLETTTPGRHQ